MILFFACRRGRVRDIMPLQLGAAACGHKFLVMLLPFAAPLIVAAAMLRLFGVRVHLVLSDKFPLDQWLARLYGRHATRMLWNYADEWPESGTRLPTQKVCFFTEAGQSAELFVFAPQPQPRGEPARGQTRDVVFLGDVNTDFSLPRGGDWWRAQFGAMREQHGYGFYMHPDLEQLIVQTLAEQAQRRAARVLAKNLLRLWIVEDARREFGERVTLVGSNWANYSQAADPSSYAVQDRLDYFRSAIVNLDCGSKSGNGALYPRSSELISFAGGIFQVRCADSPGVFGERMSEFCFTTRDELVAGIARRMAEPVTIRAERDAWLREHLRERRLLMQHSFDRLLTQC